jgi:hypothetical protein
MYIGPQLQKIPIGILTKIRKLCLQFSMVRAKDSGGIPLVKWSCLAMPKELGGWGIKNIVWFCKLLVAKSLWRLIHNNMLWGRVLTSKYLAGKSFVEWFRSQKKIGNNSSIGWRAMA